MTSFYVWRAAIIAAAFNALLNPSVVLLGNLHIGFMPIRYVILDALLSSVGVALVVAFFGVRRVRRAFKHREPVVPHSGTALERRLIAELPGSAWAFATVIGVAAAALLTLVLVVLGLLGLDGLAFADFSLFISLYTGALAFVVMRWTILRELMARVGEPSEAVP